MYHGFSIQIDGVTIGRITSWNPMNLTRSATLVKELNADTWGAPVDIVPAGEDDRAMLGAAPYNLLIDQKRPFDLQEIYYKGNTLYQVTEYYACWFTGKTTDNFTGDGNAIVSISATIMCANRRTRIPG